MNRKAGHRVVRAVEPLGKQLEWPWWSSWALVAIVISAIATVAATINDIW